MHLSAVQPLTLLDFPERTACIAFVPGCTFRCGYCHNPEFVLPQMLRELKAHFIPESTFFHFLEKRNGLLDGVVVSGGEPTIMEDLVPFIRTIKEMGFLVKLDTNGNRPEVLSRLFEEELLDYIAMDVKISINAYRGLVGQRVLPEKIERSITCIKESGIDYEFRSTLIKEIHTPDILMDMAALLNGANELYLQTFRPAHTLNPVFELYHPFSVDEMNDIASIFQKTVHHVFIR